MHRHIQFPRHRLEAGIVEELGRLALEGLPIRVIVVLRVKKLGSRCEGIGPSIEDCDAKIFRIFLRLFQSTFEACDAAIFTFFAGLRAFLEVAIDAPLSGFIQRPMLNNFDGFFVGAANAPMSV